ncbi:MAG: FG-GAP-like repeat-containing protein [Acidobacteriota bacterium]|nr:FG-GAP-like repeat-containing protein [Acidobacteriota bacterium]
MNLHQTILWWVSPFTKLFLLTVILIANIQAQSGSSVDLSFNANPTIESGGNGGGAGSVPQPDGKIIIFGEFLNINGAAKNQLMRINADGSLDNSFNCEACNFTFRISNVGLQPDGKIIVAGATSGSSQLAFIIRLNSNGSRDLSFASPVIPPRWEISSAIVAAVQPDGKILIHFYDSQLNQNMPCSTYAMRQSSLLRLNADGSIDQTFSRIFYASSCYTYELPGFRLQPDGKILAAVNILEEGGGAYLRRYNSDGTVDASFQPPRVRGDFYTRIYDFAVQANGSIVMSGYFSTVDTFPPIFVNGIVRMLPGGSIDTSFTPQISYPSGVKTLSNGQLMVSKDNKLYRLNSNGVIDNTFNSPSSLRTLARWFLDSAERIIVFGEFLENGASVYRYARLNADGSLDPTFNVGIQSAGSVFALATQTDGKIIVGGNFSRMNNVPRKNLARLNADGSLDPTFNSGNTFGYAVRKIIFQPDGKILILSDKAPFTNTAQIFRLNPDGSLVESFVLTEGYIFGIGLQTDGKIVVGGNFQGYPGVFSRHIGRLNADGSLDTSFTPGNSIATFSSLLIQADGKILVGGQITISGEPNTRGLFRLNSDGSRGVTFNSNIFPAVIQIEALPDGKLLVVANTVARLNPNGTRDTSFQSQTYNGSTQSPHFGTGVNVILPQPDGSVLVGGNFTAINNVPRSNLLRLKPNGTLDSSFLPNGTNGQVREIIKTAGGKVLIGGDFTSVANINRVSVAKLVISNPTPFDYDGDGKADISVFRPSAGDWYLSRSSDGAFAGTHFGANGDLIAPADFDGDGKTDISVFRPSTGSWYRLNSSDNSFTAIQFGAAGDLPVPGDYDGDGRADVSIYRPSAGSWYRLNSSNSQSVGVQFGISEDKPIVGDFDGDGKSDLTVFRPSNGTWYRINSSNDSFSPNQFGATGDLPVAADYDGDGKTDLAVYRPSAGDWYIVNSGNQSFTGIHFGITEDRPAPADFDGDGKADLAVFRPSNGAWYLLRSTAGFIGLQFGENGDIPTPNAFVR